jgi:hypothetical protein
MGTEARCRAVWEGASSKGRAYLETDALVFRGSRRLSIPYKDMRAVEAASGRLAISFSSGTAYFELGAKAEQWARRIRNPKGLLDKLGVKQHHRVVVVGLDDEDFLAQLRARADRVTRRLTPNADVVFFAANKRSDLHRLERIKDYLKPNGALWVVRPKDSGAITEREVMAGGKEAGLVDVKVVRFSDTHTAEKFVIPVAARPRGNAK